MTDALTKALRKGQACADEHRPHIDYIKGLAQVNPQIQQAADQLEAQLESLVSICEVGLQMAKAAPAA